jgi:hypothetical protein
MKKTCLGLLLVAAAPALADTLVDRPIVTHPGAGIGGADASAICNAPGNIFGYSWLQGTFRSADKFMVPAADTGGWDVDEICFFGYQTGATAPTITAASVRIMEGGANPDLGVLKWGDQVTNVMSSNTLGNRYRVTQTTLTNNQRREQVIRVKISPALHLDAGKEYWVDYGATGSAAFSGPWSPVAADPSNACRLGNGMVYTHSTATWAPAWHDNLGATLQAELFLLVKGTKASGCYADCEKDGDKDVFDFLCFQNEHANKTAYGDCEKDGDWDVFDFLCYQNEYANCPL